jgi:glyoxylase-like metal-dependent hydrolase (beta-lactamase superfamily II)
VIIAKKLCKHVATLGGPLDIHRLGGDISVLNDQFLVPGIGVLPGNAFVVHANEPVVVDTGLSLPGRGFLDTLGSVVDPADVRWIWLTHPDRDHTGALFDLLDAAPHARLVTTFLSAGILSTQQPVPLHRLHLLNPGQSLDVGDRTLYSIQTAAIRQSRNSRLLRRPLTNLLQLRLFRCSHAQR